MKTCFHLPSKSWFRIALFGVFGLALSLTLSSSFFPWPFPAEGRSVPSPQSNAAQSVIASFPHDFFFGLANAPAQVEDQLSDSWMDFARRGEVAAFANQALPEEKLRFYSQPETELDLAARTGVQVLRMGIDWGRLVPLEPGSLAADGRIVPEGIQDRQALAQYRHIITLARERGLKVMVTLFHHSLPRWAVTRGGWLDPAMPDHFTAFAASAARELGDQVDSWVTFNEANVYLLMTYVTGAWPPGLPADYTSFIDMPQRRGNYNIAFDAIVKAHKAAYAAIHRQSPGTQVGIAHFISQYFAYSVADIPLVFASRNLKGSMDFPDAIEEFLDFLGLNYYGEEVLKGTSVAFLPGREYSDSGRSIYPEGLYRVLRFANERYNTGLKLLFPRKPLPLVITENGISDEDDIFRPSYLIEHLLAIRQALDEGIPVLGYIFWTISDNFEWADGYGPKFGLVAVDRANQLERHPRASYYLFSDIVTKRLITQGQRDQAWRHITDRVGTLRKFYRADNGKTALDSPALRRVSATDWRLPPRGNIASWSAITWFDGLIDKVLPISDATPFNRPYPVQ